MDAAVRANVRPIAFHDADLVLGNFNSKLSRIVHEQGRPQLQGDISSWGDPESPNCRGFTPEEFHMLDFSRIDRSEWYGDIEVKAQDEIESEMEESIESFYDKFSD